MATKINMEKTGQAQGQSIHYGGIDKLKNMENDLERFLGMLGASTADFQEDKAFDEILGYIKRYDRVLYSTISNLIYRRYDSKDYAGDPIGTIQSNLEALVRYAQDDNNIATKKAAQASDEDRAKIDNARKIILKIWDHVTLASQQYTMLKETDEEYDARFKARIASYKEEMSKQMNAQMITMVGIFTALAFLIFGSISSLDGIFENFEFPLFKTMSIGLIWGLSVANMIFVFLYCVGKMTRLNFKANDDPSATIFQRYPIVWWTNLVLVALLLLSIWGYFIQQGEIGIWLLSFTNGNPTPVFWIGSIVILVVIIVTGIILAKKTKYN